MPDILPLTHPKPKNFKITRLNSVFLKLGGSLEMMLVLVFWVILFSDTKTLGGFDRQDMVTYMLFGWLISLVTGYLLHKAIRRDLASRDSQFLVLKPLKYLLHIVGGFRFHILPLFLALLLNVVIISFFLKSMILHFDIRIISLVLIMIVLAFLSEFLLAYLFNMFIFWTIESKDLYRFLLRIKNFFAGAYFPLSLLPPLALNASLLMPFAYSFFVPMQIYLKKISLHAGLVGLIIQLFWILVLYAAIKVAWSRQVRIRLEKISLR